MDYNQAIAFKELERKIDDIGLMVAELIIEKRKNESKNQAKK